MKNKYIANILHQLADLLEIKGENTFKVQAYRKAARTVENSRVAIAEIEDRLEELSGIGKGTAAVIREIISIGHCKQLEELKEQLPPDLPDLLHLPGIGPKTIATLYKQLQITNLNELKAAAEKQEIRSLPGFGPKKEQKILEAIEQFSKRPERYHLHEARRVAEKVQAYLSEMEEIERFELAGSIRRWKETIKDIDFVVATRDPIVVAEKIIAIPEVRQVVGQGETKVSIVVEVEGIVMGVDIRLVRPDQFGSALHHFTGSKEHNVRIRQRAKQLGWKVSEYGIYDPETHQTMKFAQEAQFFAQLGLPWIPPELREDRGEMEEAEAGRLPTLIRLEDYRGDLHLHTLYSDGTDTIYSMAKAAQERGYEYIAITDHSRSLKVAGGLSIDEVYEQWEEIEQVKRQLPGIEILKGTEVDILPDGTLDYPDELLKEMDLVIASVHSQFHQDEKTMTRRIVKAMENPYVHIIAHPTGRLLLRRDPYEVDVDVIFRHARETGTIFELNANPYRLDLSDELLKRAKEEYGLKFTINTDAHATEGFSQVIFGIATARRGWLEKQDVINTYSFHQLKNALKKS
ncbi:DNA polymerase/3'-5' exonuclease PolX [Thermoflavimicrobium dichotomicum]|uniref:DNA-directed DNA polymerase n=1 Tax=Thermoflavimicrobium dichotomicum TaxID=46223 RepID=A0A1I3L720_9BACL|nr:DNA polymerase/3'-5' exonuclease PolX [Thermoflavimicrobium dichotomicum]SFI80582.1 DNA polymerase (family 10) [Thermoflavimicrobium dichotomicum]